jgi:hypothetical protein
MNLISQVFRFVHLTVLTGILITLHACDRNDHLSSAPANPPLILSDVFPLRTEASVRHLIDASGRPFLVRAGSAWSLLAQLSLADAERYLEDRRRKGFNAVIANLIEHKFADKAPRNHYGNGPFVSPGDFGSPNEAYFAHVEHVVQIAAAKGIVMILAPSYLGFRGSDQGWYQAMLQNGPAKMRAYGRYLGQRFGKYSNILWMHGGDWNPPPIGKGLVREIALGIREFDARALHTAHCQAETSALEYWSGESWLQVNNIYTYVDVYAKARSAFSVSMPFLLIESGYENEAFFSKGTEQQVRVQAYHALLSGATGHAFGNNPMWYFSGPSGSFPPPSPPAPRRWSGWLDSPGARSMSHLSQLIAARPWWKLVPDFSNSFLTDGWLGSGAPFDRAVAAKAEDRSFAIIYVPSARSIAVRLAELAGPRIKASWIDPSNGETVAVAITDSRSAVTSGSQRFSTPGRNASATGSYSDWILLLESAQ